LRQLTRAVIAEDTLARIQSVKKPEELLTILQVDILRQLTTAVIAEDTLARIQSVKKPEELLTILQGN